MSKPRFTFFLLIAIFVITSFSSYPIPQYSLSVSTGSIYTPIVGGNPFVWRISSSPNDEDYTAPTPIGFPFFYNGSLVTDIQVSVNGFLKFSNPSIGDTLLSAVFANNLRSFTRNVLAPLWDDIAVNNSSTDILWQMVGPFGSRVFTVEWTNVKWNYTATTNYNFKVVLYEGSNNIEFHYGPQSGTLVSPSATIGLNDNTQIATNSTAFTEATGTYLSLSMGGSSGTRVYHQSMGIEYSGLTFAPDPGTVLNFLPVLPSPMSGVYLVPGAFPTLSDAAMALNINGINGPVTINILSGVYDDIFHLINVPGTSASNTITIQSAGGPVTLSPRNGTSSTGAASATAGDAIIRLDGTKYTTIDGLQLVENTSNTTTLQKYEMGIFLGNAIITSYSSQIVVGARYNVLKNLFIDMNSMSGTANNSTIGIRFGTNGPNGDTSQTNSYNKILDCEIVDFWRAAVFMYGFSGTVPDVGNVISAVSGRNKFRDVNITSGTSIDIRVIEINAQKDFIIEKTDIYDIIANVLTTNGIYGIRMNPASGADGISGNCTIRDVNIYNLRNQGSQVTTGFAHGIETNNALPFSTLNIYNCKVYGLYTYGNSTCRTTGMLLNFGTLANGTVNAYNNFVYDLQAPRGTSAPTVRGLDIQSAAGGILKANIYYNTIFVDTTGIPVIANHNSAAIHLANLGTSSVDLRNNIIINLMSAGTSPTTARATCIWATANTNLLRLAPTTNNNLFYVGTTPSTTKPIAWDAATAYTSMSSYRGALASGGLGGPRELQSVYEFPPFVSTTPSSYDLHLSASPATLAESGALPISGILTDYDGNTRSLTFPDIGADEFSGTAATDIVSPAIVYTQLGNTSSLSDRNLTAKITDLSGVASGTNAPRLYYKKGILGTYQIDDSPVVIGSNYTWTISATALGGLAAGDTIFYYLAAQDIAATPNLTTDPAGGSGTNPPGTTAPSTVRSYRIIAGPLSGTYTVGLSLFNKITGKNLVVTTLTKNVVEKVRVTRNLKPIEKIDLNPTVLKDIEEVPGFDMAYSFDTLLYSPTEFEIKEIQKEYTALLENGKLYEGPQFISVTKAQLTNLGIDTRGLENIEGVYPTIAAAVADLNLRGVSGPVTLSLVDATYSETAVEINSVAGVSPTNTITIKPAGGVDAVWTHSSAQIKITNTSYVTIDGSNTIGGTTRNFTINRSTTAGNAVWIASLDINPITNVTVKNCNIWTGEVTASNCVMISDAATSGNSGYFSNITIQNNDFRKCRIAVYANGGSSYTQNGFNVAYLDNDVGVNAPLADAVKFIGLYCQGVNGIVMRNNKIGKFEFATAENDRGIWVASGTTNAIVEQNRVYDLDATPAGQGANGIVVSTALGNCNVDIRNNFIWNIKGLGSSTVNQNPLGIYIFGNQSGISIYNNSIYLTGALSASSAAANFSAGVCLSARSFANVMNNAIHNNLGKDPLSAAVNGAMGVFAFQSPSQFTMLSNNVYYFNPQPGTFISYGHVNGLGWLGFNQPLSVWQANTGKDANSFAENPKFVNPAIGDLHIVTNTGTPCESGGLPVVGNDIDGDPRNPLTPDIGADEFAGTKFMTLNLTAMIEGICDGTNIQPDTIKVILRNTSAPYDIVESKDVVLNTSGFAPVNFRDPLVGTNYYISLKHRNALQTWSKAGGESWSSLAPISYNFTTSASQAYGSNQVLVGSKYCIYSGDVSDGVTAGIQDGYIDIFDDFEVYNDSYSATYRLLTDLNLDGFVDIFDDLYVYNNSYNGVTASYPGFPRPGFLKKDTSKFEINKEVE